MTKGLFAKGKRGHIYLEWDNGRNVIVKKKNPNSKTDTLSIEAKFLQIVNKYNIGPKIINFCGEEIVMEFIKGDFILDFIEKNNKKDVMGVLLKIFEQMFILDKLGINKFEMTHPHKHIIVRKKEPILIDFERCRYSEKPKNISQYCPVSYTHLRAHET